MKLDYTYAEIAHLLNNQISESDKPIYAVAFDSRRIPNGENVLFFALNGLFRDGHTFLSDAYDKGVRHFVVSRKGATKDLPEANEIVVEDTLQALQDLAAHHRLRFKCEVIGITGSNGKTTVKEWLAHLLGKKFNVVRSPKSYNSQIGVALSLFEINSETEIAIIEAGISRKGEMGNLFRMIRPTNGILTSFGTAHQENFNTQEEHFHEKTGLFQEINFIYPEGEFDYILTNGIPVNLKEKDKVLGKSSMQDKISRKNLSLVVQMAQQLGMNEEEIGNELTELNPLALRLETVEGINGNTIINDTYNLDMDSLHNSLEYQLANSLGKRRVVIIGLPTKDSNREKAIREIVNEFLPDELFFSYLDETFNLTFSNSNILIKGTRSARMERVARKFKLRNHQTFLEFNLKSIRHNINSYKQLLKSETNILCMIKASSYGTDPREMGVFLEQMGINYLGVAYPDEGVELREKGIQLPILVMNCEEDNFPVLIEHRLEPAIFSINQLELFIHELIDQSITDYPVHLKLETGMNRLGFIESDLHNLLHLLKGQPEILIKSIYSHLAESDRVNSEFTIEQISTFERMSEIIMREFSYPIMRHILNSDGIVNYPEAQFDMVRLGIGMYGITSNKEHKSQLEPAISWKSTVSQVKELNIGATVGYSRFFKAEEKMEIAIIPVGYADGFRRSLSKGIGGVYIRDVYCPVVGNVCMDMIMVDVRNITVKEGDKVEIIGLNQTMEDFALKMQTIPYEVMTGFSRRVHRVFID